MGILSYGILSVTDISNLYGIVFSGRCDTVAGIQS